jgi:hypothetical protein
MADDDSDGSDEWGMEELVIPPNGAMRQEEDANANANDNDDFWKVEPSKEKEEPKKEAAPKQPKSEGGPMIIVDMTQIDGNIHSKFDKNSVNDADAASALRKKWGSNYDQYAKDASLLANGTIIPCGSSVWRDALVRLRGERPGHYFAPIFPPAESK